MKKIKDIKKIKLEKVPFNYVLSKIESLIDNSFVSFTHNASINWAYRARKNDGKDLFAHTKELWYPPKEKIIQYGRLNKPRNQIFYVAETEGVSVLELKPKAGDLITVMMLEYTGHRNINFFEIGVSETHFQYGIKDGPTLIENSKCGRSFLQEKGYKNNLKIRNFLAGEMMKIVPQGFEYQYKTTAAIGELFLLNTPKEKIDGFMYPSIAGDGSRKKGGKNLALKPHFADAYFKPKEIWVVEVKRVLEDLRCEVICQKKAKTIREDGLIIW